MEIEHTRFGKALVEFVDVVEVDLVWATQPGEDCEAQFPEDVAGPFIGGFKDLLEGWVLFVFSRSG